MPTNYPGSLDTTTQHPNSATNGGVIPASTDNNHSDALIAIEAELGVNPSGNATTVAARLGTIEGQAFNVKASPYDATGDGSTDDSAAIQAALNAVPASGGSVYFPAGTYVVSALKVKAKTRLYGAGIGNTILKLKNSAAGIGADWPYATHRAILYNDGATGSGATDITLEGIEFDGNVTNNVAIEQTYCAAFCGVQRLFVHDCYFRDIRAEGVVLMVNTPGTIVENEDCHIQNCILYNCGFTNGGAGLTRQGIAVISGVRIVVRGITAKKIASAVIDFEADTSDHQFRNCIVSDIVGEDVGVGIIFISQDIGDSTDNLISNVTLKDGPSGALSWGIILEKQQRLIIRGLASDYVFNGSPVSATTCEDISIFDVHSMGSNNGGSGYAIRLISTSRVFVQGCSLRHTGGGQTYAVGETTAAGPTTVNGNHILEGSSGPALFTHADSRLIDPQSGGGLKQPVRVASTANVNIASPGATIDGVTMSAGPPQDRVLLAGQTTTSQNGLYLWNGAAAAMTRAIDANTASKLSESLLVTVDEGTVNKDSVWTLSTNKPITLGSTALRFTRLHPSAVAGTQPSGIYYAPGSAKLENMPRAQTPFSNQALLATGTVRVFPLGVVRAGDTVSSLNFRVGTTASASITNSWAGIARLSDRAVLAISASSTATTAAQGLKTFTFGTPYTADKDELVVGFVMYQATTPPSLHGINQGDASIMADTPVVNGTSNTGATTPVAVGATLTAFTADTEIPYCYAA
jgi:hypothetical protein